MLNEWLFPGGGTAYPHGYRMELSEWNFGLELL
jgi:hypothetical protein